VTEWRATTSRHRMAPCVSRGKSWVLAMLAPKQGLRVAPVPPKSADLTRPPRGRLDNGRSGRRNRRFDRTKEQPRTSSPCGHDHPSLTVVHPMVGQTEHASHTEIRTLPEQQNLHLFWIDSICDRLLDDPELGKPREELIVSVRSIVIWPHVVFYRVARSKTEIVRIIHQREDIGSVVHPS
jgi:hypothetical protein